MNTQRHAGSDAKILQVIDDLPLPVAGLIAVSNMGLTDAEVAQSSLPELRDKIRLSYQSGTLEGAIIHDAYFDAPDSDFEGGVA